MPSEATVTLELRTQLEQVRVAFEMGFLLLLIPSSLIIPSSFRHVFFPVVFVSGIPANAHLPHFFRSPEKKHTRTHTHLK